MSAENLFINSAEKRFKEKYKGDSLDFSTKQKAIEIRTDVIESGGYFISSTDWHLSMKLVKEAIIWCINESKSEIIDIHCSPEVKLKLQNHFWFDDFCYLGTRIRLHSHDSFNGWRGQNEQPEDYSLLFVANNIPIACIERCI